MTVNELMHKLAAMPQGDEVGVAVVLNHNDTPTFSVAQVSVVQVYDWRTETSDRTMVLFDLGPEVEI